MGRNPSVNSIGVLNRIEPPHRLRNNIVRMIIEGIDIMIVVVWKKALMAVPIPVMYMWCAQTMKERNPTANTDQTMGLYPMMGLRVLLASTSVTIPSAGR